VHLEFLSALLSVDVCILSWLDLISCIICYLKWLGLTDFRCSYGEACRNIYFVHYINAGLF